MYKYLLQGLLVGLAYVAPIGTQNLYVINTAIRSKLPKALQTALIVIFFDISLGISCFLGMGYLIEKFQFIKAAMLLIGGLAVTYIGINLIRSTSKLKDDVEIDENLMKVVKSCFVVTWLNPQAIIDGTLLLGGIRASLPSDMAIYFIIGVCLASTLWFTTLASVATLIKTKIAGALKYLNVACGLIITFYGLKLVYAFVQLFINK